MDDLALGPRIDLASLDAVFHEGMEKIYRRCLAVPVPAGTHPARLPC